MPERRVGERSWRSSKAATGKRVFSGWSNHRGKSLELAPPEISPMPALAVSSPTEANVKRHDRWTYSSMFGRRTTCCCYFQVRLRKTWEELLSPVPYMKWPRTPIAALLLHPSPSSPFNSYSMEFINYYACLDPGASMTA